MAHIFLQRHGQMLGNLHPPSPPLPQTVRLSCVCERERGTGQTGKRQEEGVRKRKGADRRKIVTVFLPPAGNELVKEKSE